MEGKVKKYEDILVNWLEDYTRKATDAVTEYQFICDKTKHLYQVVRINWDREGIFWDVVIFHFQIKPADGKVWIYANNTDRQIGEEFKNLGIPASDIVLGFIPKEWRAESGYAVA